jgi:hypothetical protein
MSPCRLPLSVIVALGAVLGLLASGCGGGGAAPAPSENPGVLITRILSEELNGQWSRQWTELHPGHQKLITRSQYVACSRSIGTNIATGKEIFHVLAVDNQAIHVRGVPQRTAKIVTINVRQKGTSPGLTYRLHAVAVGDQWTWILGDRFLSQLAHGRCLDGTRLVATT